MRLKLRVLILTILSALVALPALAQEAEAAAPELSSPGLGLLMIIAGLGAVAIVGYLMSRRESTADDDDLV